MSKAVLTFALYQADQLLRRESISQDIIKVGKDPKSHLQIDDPLASRMHAVIEVSSLDDVNLIDLGNEPATQVNGAPVSNRKLAVGDQIRIGGTRLILERIDPPGAQAQPAVPGAASSNPFAAGAAFGGGAAAGSNPFGAPDDAAPGTYTYEMLRSGPDVPADEVETHAPACEVSIAWGTNVLHVSHLAPPRDFYVGEGSGKDATDFFIPEEKLPARKTPIVLGD